MKKRLKFPIRLKILVTLLLVVTTVVSLITFTMARLFHDDKEAYVHDLSSMVARSTAEESRAVLDGFASKLNVYARVMTRTDISSEGKSALVKGLFVEFPDLVAVSIVADNREIASAFDPSDLETFDISAEDLAAHDASRRASATDVPQGRLRIAATSIAGKLPVLDVEMPITESVGADRAVLRALVGTDTITRICSRSRVFETYLVGTGGEIVASADPRLDGAMGTLTIPEEAREVLEGYAAGKSLEFSLRGRNVIGGFAAVNFAGLTAVTVVPASTAFLASRDLLRGLIGVALLLLVLTAIISVFWSRRITSPLERLSYATNKIGQGEFDVTVNVDSGDEIGTLAASFNRMAGELDTRDKALKQAEAQLVQSEKMAAFGLLGAGIAHEVKNPLAGILGCAQISLRKADPGSLLHENLKLIEKETKRCKTIIENLLKFARQEKTTFDEIDPNGPVEDAISIVHHQLELQKVKLERDLAETLPRISGNANQLQQVFMNLMINAQQAMGADGGRVTVTTRAAAPDRVEIRVSDTGPGVPPEIQRRVFDPFFTTKPNGKGTGLGLSVSYGIVKDHGGEITLESEPGRGATFVIVLPAVAAERPPVTMDADDPRTDVKAPAEPAHHA